MEESQKFLVFAVVVVVITLGVYVWYRMNGTPCSGDDKGTFGQHYTPKPATDLLDTYTPQELVFTKPERWLANFPPYPTNGYPSCPVEQPRPHRLVGGTGLYCPPQCIDRVAHMCNTECVMREFTGLGTKDGFLALDLARSEAGAELPTGDQGDFWAKNGLGVTGYKVPTFNESHATDHSPPVVFHGDGNSKAIMFDTPFTMWSPHDASKDAATK